MKQSRAGCPPMQNSFGFYSDTFQRTKQETSDRIMPWSIRPYLWESFTNGQSTFFLLDFILLLPTGSITGILYSKELITSTVSLKARFSTHWSSRSPPSYYNVDAGLGILGLASSQSRKTCCHREI